MNYFDERIAGGYDADSTDRFDPRLSPRRTAPCGPPSSI